MAEAQAAPAPTADAPLRIRTIVLWSIMAALVLTFIWLWIRGSWTDTQERDPSTVADGVLTQLYRDPDGRTVVRSSAILAAPPDRVWGVITDYAHFPEIFHSGLWKMMGNQATHEADGRWHMTGRVETALGTYPVDILLEHEETPQKCVASWDESTSDFMVNRGWWRLTPSGEGKSLLVFALEVKVEPYPRFLVHNVLLSQNDGVIETVRRRLASDGR